MFSEADFEEKALKIPQEEKFIRYLLSLQQAMMKLNAKSENFSQNCCPNYVARGMGLVTGEQNKNTLFYIYSTSTSAATKDLIVNIRGPFASYATITIPAFRNSSLRPINSKKLIFENKQRKSFLQTISMDLMNLDKNDTIIPLKIEMEQDRAAVTFIPRHTGMYQVTLTSNNEHLAGSPYNLRVLKGESSGDDSKTRSEVKTTRKRILTKIAGFIDNNFASSKARSLFRTDDDFEMSFINRAKSVVIPHTGYSIKRIENIGDLTPKIVMTKQVFQEKESSTESLVEVSPDKITSSICTMHIVPEEKSGEEFELSTFSVKESASEQPQGTKSEPNPVEDAIEWREVVRPPKKLKAFIKEKKEYWDSLILMNTKNNSKSIPVNLNKLHLENHEIGAKALVSKSLETLDRKLDFDFSFDASVEEAEIPSIRDRKSILIQQLTDEQKLLQIQNEKKMENLSGNKNARKPKRHESFSSVVDRIQMFNSGKFCFV